MTRSIWPFVRGVGGLVRLWVRRSCRIVWAHCADRYVPPLSVSAAVTRPPRVAYHATARASNALVAGARSSGRTLAQTTQRSVSVATWTSLQPMPRACRGRDERREPLQPFLAQPSHDG